MYVYERSLLWGLFKSELGTIGSIFELRRSARINRRGMGTIISFPRAHPHPDSRVAIYTKRNEIIRAWTVMAIISDGVLSSFVHFWTWTQIFNRIHCVLACCGGRVIVQTPSSMIEKTLDSIYLDPSQPASFAGLDAVYRAVKGKGNNKISCKQGRDWLSQQDVYILHKPTQRR